MSHGEDKKRLDHMLAQAKAVTTVPPESDAVKYVEEPAAIWPWDDVDDDEPVVAKQAPVVEESANVRVRILGRVTIELEGVYKTFLPGSRYTGHLAKQIALAAPDSPHVRVEVID